jgi:hypothetical protein
MKKNRESLRQLLKPGSIRQAIAIREILGPPKSLENNLWNMAKKRDIARNSKK